MVGEGGTVYGRRRRDSVWQEKEGQCMVGEGGIDELTMNKQ